MAVVPLSTALKSAGGSGDAGALDVTETSAAVLSSVVAAPHPDTMSSEPAAAQATSAPLARSASGLPRHSRVISVPPLLDVRHFGRQEKDVHEARRDGEHDRLPQSGQSRVIPDVPPPHGACDDPARRSRRHPEV